MITVPVDEVQRSRPTCVETDLVRPGGHRRKVAGRIGPHLVVVSEDRADGLEDLRLEVGLGNCGNNFVAWLVLFRMFALA
jgi:hypothetical protein